MTEPEVERARTAIVHEAEASEGIECEGAPFCITSALDLDVIVVAERGDRRGLHRYRHHEPGVLAGFDEIRNELAIAGVETHAHPRKVRALRQAVHREHAFEPTGENGRGLRREFGVALVAGDDDSPLPRPGCGGDELISGRDRRGRVPRLV